MQFFTIYAVYRVDHKVIMQVARVQMRCHHHLKIRKLARRKLQTDGVCLLRSKVIFLQERLHEVIKLSAVSLVKSFLRCHHLGESTLRNAVVARHKFRISPLGFVILRYIF